MVYSDGQYSSREDFDAVFESNAKLKYNGLADKNINFITRVQLKDKSLWRMVSHVFDTYADAADNGWRGEYWGKLMRGACKTYEYTRDNELYEILKESAGELLSFADSDGRISSYSRENEFCGWDMWARKYVMLGLLHFYEICRSDDIKDRVLNALKKHLDYICARLKDGKLAISETSDIWQGVNSCSVLEPVVRMYNLTHEPRYLNIAEHIVSCGFASECDIIELALENKILPFEYPVNKAYEVMSCFEGLAEYYRVTKIEKYKTALINFVNALMDSEVTAIGCLGCHCEKFNNARITQANDDHLFYMQETCVTVTWMKLCAQLYELTGDVSYIEQIEKSYYNAMLGAVNIGLCENEVGIYPFESYSPTVIDRRGRGIGGFKTMDGGNCGCCVAIGAMGLAMFPSLSVMNDEDKNIIFNLYESGTIETDTKNGGKIVFDEETEYPLKGRIKFKISLEKPQKMNINFRVPRFAKNFRILICGADNGGVPRRGYFSADREWSNGDTIEILFDIPFEKVVMDNGVAERVCFKYGALTTARDLRFDKNSGRAVKSLNGAHYNLMNTDTTDECLLKAEIKTDKDIIYLVDYASAGKTLDFNSVFETWIAVQNESGGERKFFNCHNANEVEIKTEELPN